MLNAGGCRLKDCVGRHLMEDAPRLYFCWPGESSFNGGLICVTGPDDMGWSSANGSCSAASFLKDCDIAVLLAYAAARRAQRLLVFNVRIII